MTIRSLACALCMKKSTLHSRLNNGGIRKHSNAIKPHLTEENKVSRLQFCISMIGPASIPHDPLFMDMHNEETLPQNTNQVRVSCF